MKQIIYYIILYMICSTRLFKFAFEIICCALVYMCALAALIYCVRIARSHYTDYYWDFMIVSVLGTLIIFWVSIYGNVTGPQTLVHLMIVGGLIGMLIVWFSDFMMECGNKRIYLLGTPIGLIVGYSVNPAVLVPIIVCAIIISNGHIMMHIHNRMFSIYLGIFATGCVCGLIVGLFKSVISL